MSSSNNDVKCGTCGGAVKIRIVGDWGWGDPGLTQEVPVCVVDENHVVDPPVSIFDLRVGYNQIVIARQAGGARETTAFENFAGLIDKASPVVVKQLFAEQLR